MTYQDTTAKVLYIHEHFPEFGHGSASSVKYNASDEPSEKLTYTKDEPSLTKEHFEIIGHLTKRYINEAFYKIVDAKDEESSQVERSNNFDEWKDLLKTIIRHQEYITNNHLKIVASLITSTKNSDISDFDNEQLKTLADVTNTLRLPRMTRKESRAAISALSSHRFETVIPMFANQLSGKEADDIEEMLSSLVKKGNKLESS